jgi:hypothetical protein
MRVKHIEYLPVRSLIKLLQVVRLRSRSSQISIYVPFTLLSIVCMLENQDTSIRHLSLRFRIPIDTYQRQ